MRDEWVGVDLDGTLARDDTPRTKPTDIGEPVPAMIAFVRTMLWMGVEVRIVTARVSEVGARNFGMTPEEQRKQIQDWCFKYLGQRLQVQCEKDYLMTELYDDRARRVQRNTGRML